MKISRCVAWRRSLTCSVVWWLALASPVCLAQSRTTAAPTADRVRLTEQTELVFVSTERGQELIGQRDAFVDRLGTLELQLRLLTAEPVTQDDYLQALREGVVAWQPAEVEQVSAAAATLRERMKPYALPFPKEVFLIRTSSEVGENAPHCRGPSIVLPDRFFDNAATIPRVLAHELFHVLSSHNAELRDELYGIIHFTPCNEVVLPEALRSQRLTNPDAPANHHVLQVSIDGQLTPIVPVILSRTAKYRAGGIFANLDFKLMVLEKRNGQYVAKLRDGRPELLGPNEVPDYAQQIGRNTGYIIHPEETLADNFWMMLLGSPRIQDQWVIDEMKEVLSE